MAAKKFYAIAVGRKPGIYDNWPQAQAQVLGFAGAVYKGFATRQEAVDWLKNPPLKYPGAKKRRSLSPSPKTELVNNAGLAVGTEPAHEAVVDDWERMIDTNVKGLLYVSRCLTPGMVERKKGHIINISSIAGKEAYPGGSVYCGTKHAVAAISKAMRIELVQHGVKVSTISPGMVETEFSIVRFKGDQSKAGSVYKGLTPLYAQDIAETILFMVTRPAHVNLDDVLIMPTDQASARDARRDQ